MECGCFCCYGFIRFVRYIYNRRTDGKLADVKDAVGLQRQSPVGVGEHGLDGGLHVALAVALVAHPAGLQVAVLGCDVVVLGQVLAQIDHLQFIAAGEHHGQVAAVAEARLGR